MEYCETLIHADTIITQDDKRQIITDGGIAISRGKILAIDIWDNISPVWHGEKSLDLQGKMVMPGLINGHAHAAMTFLRGLAEDQPLMSWLNETVFPIEARLTPEIVRLGSLLGHAEMLACGTTACVDMYMFEEAVLGAADLCGIRCLGGEAVFQFPSAACADYRAALHKTAALADKYSSHDRIDIAVNPHSVYTTTAQILRDCRGLAIEFNLPLHIHLAETHAETEACLRLNGMRPVAWCEDQGIFDTRLIAAHLVDINESEAKLLAASNIIGCYNPSSNMKLGSGVAPVGLMLDAGMKVALGTDGPASNNQLNMFNEMSRGALLQKLCSKDASKLSAQTILDMATRNGAELFRKNGLGQLSTGSPADLIALDVSLPNMQPMHNPVAQVVYAASGYEVVMTMVAGEVLYDNGSFLRFDYPALMDEMAQIKKFVASKK